MSFNPPEGILDIGNATLRVGKLEVSETTGLNQGLQNIVKNDLLITEKETYLTNKTWGIKLPTAWVGEFDLKTHDNKYVEFNFYNEGSTSNAHGYTLNFKDTTLTLKYDNGNTLASETIPDVSTSTYKKVNVFFERGVIAVFIDGARVLYFKESDTYNSVHGHPGVATRVVSTTGGSFVNIFIEADGSDSAVKDLRIVNGRLISDKTSNVSFIGSLGVGVHSPQESLDIRGNMHFNRVSNVSQVSVDSNVVTEYTGPHDRPLRKYPEVNFLGDGDLTQFGYTASSSGQYGTSGTYPASNAFTGTAATTQNAWVSPMSTFETTQTNNGSIANSTNVFTDAPSGEQNGPWLKIELPNAIKLSHSKIYRWHASAYDTRLKDGYIYGSNDDSTYTRLARLNNLGTSWDQYTGATINVNATEHYKYYVLHVREIYQTSDTTAASAPYVTLGEWELYGREEGDASLDTTLKTVYNVPATTGTQLEVYYDGQDYSADTDFDQANEVLDKSGNNLHGSQNGGVGFDTTYKAFTFDGSSSQNITSSALGFTGDQPHTFSFWIKDNEMNHTNTIVMHIGRTTHAASQNSSIEFKSDRIRWASYANDIEYPLTGITSNTWYHITGSYVGGGATPENKSLYINGKRFDDTGYNIFSGWEATAGDPLSFQSDAFVTLGSSTAIGTTHFNGSIANFRLYSKALNADQVKELYDYQKDYFLGSKSQVTLYKGHLGVGVTEPSGQLELAGDERLQEYPPGPMSDYETLIPGHGVFKVYSTGGLYNNGSGGNLPWTAFNKITGTFNDGTSWVSEDAAAAGAGGNYNNGGSSGYGGTNRLSSNTPLGDYLVICLPYSIVLKSYSLSNLSGGTGYGAADFPRDYIIYGSNDDVNWEVVDSRSDQEAGGLAPDAHASASYPTYTNNYRVPENNKVYSKFAIVITDINSKPWYDYNSSINASYAGISEWRLFGTPGPTTLDKGSLSLTRSLDVPRVSRYDVDTETPRPEKLVLDLDTTVNSSPTDISGKGSHGFYHASASYVPGDKAFDIPNHSGILIRGSSLGSGAQPLTLCAWAKGGSSAGDTWNATANDCIIGVGPNSSSGHSSFQLCVNTDAITLDMASASNFVEYPVTIENYRWYFFAMTYSGGDAFTNTRVYLDGVEIAKPSSWTNGSSGTLSLPISPDIGVGTRTGNGTDDTPAGFLGGMISNPKVYNVALEPSEIKKLYNMGRTGRSMVISDTAVGIGKVPEAQLDVRGSIAARGAISSNNPAWCYWKTGSPDQNDIIYNSATDGPVTFNSLQSFGQNWETGVAGTSTARGTGRNFDPDTGTYTAPERGVYLVQFCWSMDGGGGGDDSQYALFVTSGNDDNGSSWESGGSFPNRGSNSSAYMLFNPEFITRSGIENVWCISDLILLDKGSTVQVWFKNVSSATTLEVIRANFSGIKIA